MAGSGKTTLMQRLNIHTHQQKQPAYIINLDPGTVFAVRCNEFSVFLLDVVWFCFKQVGT